VPHAHSFFHWEQSFSFDGGKTFVPNWIVVHERASGSR
jgi:hypothetical protein